MRSLLLIIILWCLSLVGYNDALTIQLLDVAQKSSLEDGTYLTRIFFTNKNLTREINYNSDKLNNGEDFSFSLRDSSEEDDDDDESDDTFDSWSIVWYIASFSGLIAFFLIVSCSEWCCRNHIRRQQQAQQAQQTVDSSTSTTRPSSPSRDVPPPSYELFAPPSYDSLWRRPPDGGEKSEFDVYVVPVHAITGLYASSTNGGSREGRLGSVDESQVRSGDEDAPPSYSVVNLGSAAEQ